MNVRLISRIHGPRKLSRTVHFASKHRLLRAYNMSAGVEAVPYAPRYIDVRSSISRAVMACGRFSKSKDNFVIVVAELT